MSDGLSEEQVIEWLKSPEGEAWSRKTHMPIFYPLVMVVRDGNSSTFMDGYRIIWRAK